MSHRKKATSSVRSLTDGAPDHTIGSRTLDDDEDVWNFNAWDHVEPPEEHIAMVDELLAKQAETRVDQQNADLYHQNAANYWDKFYSRHENRFFKDRKWLHLEFPELVQATNKDAGPMRIVEVGCGAGNTVFPLLEMNQNPALDLVACDYAEQAVNVVKTNPLCQDPPMGHCQAHVWDLSAGTAGEASLPPGIDPGSVDIVVLVFVFSALHPREWASAVNNVYTMLRPKTGLVLFRDYGRHDLPQLRFKKNRLLDDNFYVRGDGTRVYFFDPQELYTAFDAMSREASQLEMDKSEVSAANSEPQSLKIDHDAANHVQVSSARPMSPSRFVTLQMAVDRRLLVNRKERKRMYRVWVQAKFRKR
ncbi:tRNA(Thr) (cytosine(32)-N(3))-methyltransferase [Malassezia psittaci]|uniref:tRNA N(3)-methylcytidine methyltransferase n=1 Tax=Malassezia psittaci TaxID=1821823 RepID=A0AAF0F6N2_9BASI|nr:tRNA(Thr) (cytosine(32)-N(3))-methyltransferase [Malassezia psittaci]